MRTNPDFSPSVIIYTHNDLYLFSCKVGKIYFDLKKISNMGKNYHMLDFYKVMFSKQYNNSKQNNL